MKHWLSILLFCCGITLFAADLSDDMTRQAITGALDQAGLSLKKAPFGTRTVAVLPLPGDTDGLLTGHLKNLLTSNGFICVEGKEDPMWDEIVKEIAWDERKDDILDPATIVKFGKQKAAQILVYGRLRVLSRNEERIYAEIELHATDLATKQHLWGGNFAYRFYFGKDVQGIIALDSKLRQFLQTSFAKVRDSILEPVNAGKLDKIQSVTVIPLTGDVDQYLTGLTIEALSQSKHSPKNPQIPSLAVVRMQGRIGQLESDAIFYGAVRDLRKSAPKETLEGKKVITEYTLSTDFQLFLEDAKTGMILWSKTVIQEENFTEERRATAAERQQYHKEKLDSAGDEFKEDLVDNWAKYAIIFGSIIGAIVLLLLAFLGIRMYISYHNVR